MPVSHVEVLAEEQSMEAALRTLLPRLLGSISFDVYRYAGKEDLLGKLRDRLRGYAKWLPDDWRLVILVDCDDDDCHELKGRLEQFAAEAQLTTRRRIATGDAYQLVTRLAIEELEAWYFGDWNAVRSAYPKVSGNVPRQAKYRQPDDIQGGTWEALERVLQHAGYFRTGLRKIEAARAIARHMDVDRNTSPSFRTFAGVLREMASNAVRPD